MSKQVTQITVPGKIFTSKGGSEIIQFSVQLGPFYIKCDVTVPDEGTTMGPVYIKCGLRDVDSDTQSRPSPIEVTQRRPKHRAA
jgi:hypothetical protein